MSLRLFFILFVFQLFSNSFFAQERPLPIEQVRPLIDSVQMEVNRMYSLSESVKKAKELQASQDSADKFYDTFSYRKKDTTIVLGLNENENVSTCFYFLGEEIKLIKTEKYKRSLTEEENKLYRAKQIALKETRKKQYAIQAPDECAMEYIFHPNQKGYTLHFLAVPLVDSILPTGHDHHFLFGYDMKVLSHTQTKKPKIQSIRKKDNPPNSTLAMLSAPNHGKTNNFKILIPYFYKYRLYHQNVGLTQYGATINKRSLSYDAVKNEINIKLFPVEK